MMPLFQFRPIYQERMWGGRGLEAELGRTLPGFAPLGESWDIVDRPEAQSVVAEGPEAGRPLRDLMARHGNEVMGPGWPADRPFPVLVKWLDCRVRLSLQVHPPASVAAALGGEPKTENWYFARAAEGAGVLAGLKPGVTPADFAAALEQGTADACVERLPVRSGDSLLMRSGVVHALDAGCLVLEIQQNSDTTYRVYDWARVGLDGLPRALHIRESLACLAAAPAERPRVRPESAEPVVVLAEVPEFRIVRRHLATGTVLGFQAGEQPRILSVVSGTLTGPDGIHLRPGTNVLLPYAAAPVFTATSPATVLVTDRFNRTAT